MGLQEGFRLVAYSRVDDKLCGFGTSWECTSGFDPLNSAKALCNGFEATVLPLLLACQATDVTFEGLYATTLDAGAALPHRLAGTSQPGVVSGSAMPANSCIVVTLQTDDVSATRQGRCYISGAPKEQLTNGTFDAAFVSGALQALATALQNPISSGGQEFQPRIVQRIINGAPVGPNLLVVDSARVTQIPFTQRRRTTKQLSSVT